VIFSICDLPNDDALAATFASQRLRLIADDMIDAFTARYLRDLADKIDALASANEPEPRRSFRESMVLKHGGGELSNESDV